MITVIDASAAAEIVLQRKNAGRLTVQILESDWVIAPNLFIAEIANVFWKYQSLADFKPIISEKCASQSIALVDDFLDEKDYFLEAMRLGSQLKHSIYDMLYLVLARRNNATLLTMDKRLNVLAKEINLQ